MLIGTKPEIKHEFNDLTFLITGGTGSLGTILVDYLLKTRMKELRVFSRDEEKQYKMQNKITDKRVKYIIGNIRDIQTLNKSCRNVQILIHTAALKIIPVCEQHPYESIKTNLQGTINVKQAALKNNVWHNIYINTDKACNPLNVYGACKMLAEKIWNHPTQHITSKFATVRYGNVVNSRGSVIPFFKQLISQQKPLPITHPEMTRFFITMPQALKLIMHVAVNMKPNRTYIPKLKSCNIIRLAKTLAGNNYPLTQIGLRPGEKIHETLINTEEITRTETQPWFLTIHPYGKYKSGYSTITFNSQHAERLTDQELKEILK